MFRAIAAWLVVAVSGFMILPAAVTRMINYPLYYAPLMAVWLAALIVAAIVTASVKQK